MAPARPFPSGQIRASFPTRVHVRDHMCGWDRWDRWDNTKNAFCIRSLMVDVLSHLIIMAGGTGGTSSGRPGDWSPARASRRTVFASPRRAARGDRGFLDRIERADPSVGNTRLVRAKLGRSPFSAAPDLGPDQCCARAARRRMPWHFFFCLRVRTPAPSACQCFGEPCSALDRLSPGRKG